MVRSSEWSRADTSLPKVGLIVPKGRIEDPPTPKIKIFSSAPAVGGCLPPLQHISALQHTFSILINIIYITLYLIIIIIYFININ